MEINFMKYVKVYLGLTLLVEQVWKKTLRAQTCFSFICYSKGICGWMINVESLEIF